jgi:hypothetical protein
MSYPFGRGARGTGWSDRHFTASLCPSRETTHRAVLGAAHPSIHTIAKRARGDGDGDGGFHPWSRRTVRVQQTTK